MVATTKPRGNSNWRRSSIAESSAHVVHGPYRSRRDPTQGDHSSRTARMRGIHPMHEVGIMLGTVCVALLVAADGRAENPELAQKPPSDQATNAPPAQAES